MKNQKKKPAPVTSGRLQMNLPRPLYMAASEAAKITGKSIEDYIRKLVVDDQTKRIELEFTKEQLHQVLATLEGAMVEILGPGMTRGIALLEKLEAAPRSFNSYDIAMIGPVYRQLVQYWDEKNTKAARVDGDKIEEFAGRKCFPAG